MRSAAITLALLLALPAAAGNAAEEIGPWRLSCVTDRMTDRSDCTLRHRDPVERSAVGPALTLEILERHGQLLPAVTARELGLDGAARGLLAITGTAQLRFDRNPMMELPCGLEGRSLVCAPRAADAPRAAAELPGAERALVRMTGLGAQAGAAEPTELRLSDTRAAMERLRRLQPPGSAPPPPPPVLDLRELLGRLQRLMP
ncbi:MAG: hypothetical protein N3D18_10890 [Roseococcus sp.]|nr:hypothetical protein [Roseococcus sp.]